MGWYFTWSPTRFLHFSPTIAISTPETAGKTEFKLNEWNSDRAFVKGIVAKENKGELTVIEPIWECVKEDGTCITAVRPPAKKDWGIRILYGAARKERQEWQIS